MKEKNFPGGKGKNVKGISELCGYFWNGRFINLCIESSKNLEFLIIFFFV